MSLMRAGFHMVTWHRMCLDQGGFKALVQQEAAEFLSVEQRLLKATVRTVTHSRNGVTITLANGTTLSADYALYTFSLGASK